MKRELMTEIGKFRNQSVATRLVLCSFFISISAGKWGSYIGIPSMSVFLPDVLLIIGCVLAALNHKGSLAKFSSYGLISISFICFQFLRNPEYSAIIRIRDLIPYIYLSLVPLLFSIFASSDKVIFIKTLRYATLSHLCWQIPVMIGILNPLEIGGIFGYPIFSPRWDHDGIALILGVITWRRFYFFNLKENNLISGLMVITLLIQYSRAALVAFLFTLILFYFRYLKIRKKAELNQSFRLAILGTYLIAIVLIAFPLFKSYVPSDSVLVRFGLISGNGNFQEAQESAIGTANARRYAQSALFDWVKNQEHLLLGVGPGVEMVRDSGAISFLSGSPDVRSPHSWVYGLICRFGYFGAFIWVFLILTPLIKSRAILHPLDLPLMGIYPILIVSLFGVIIESPFGSLPLAVLIALSNIK